MKAYYKKKSAKSGIYKIINTNNGRIYIGKAQVFRQRFYEHRRKLLDGKHTNRFLQSDFNKCGADAFEFHIVEVVSEYADRNKAEEQCIAKFYDKQKQCYNFVKKSNAFPRRMQSKDPKTTSKLLSEKSKAMWANPEFRLKMKKIHGSEEFRKKQSENQKRVSKDPTKGNSAEANRKRHTDPKHKEKHSKALKEAWARDIDGTRKKKVSESAKKTYAANKEKITKARLRARAKHHGKVISPDGVVYDVYNLDGFCREHEIVSCGTFHNMMKGKKGYNGYKGWKRFSN